ncbi:MAG: DNA repair protein RadC [Gemmatimonadetes bacterium]|nr:DNA repair protein RadC [Gemmatimonadota bacterium]
MRDPLPPDVDPQTPLTAPRGPRRRLASIRELPAAERPRERLASHGASRLSTIELLAILLGAGSGQRSALGVAQEVLVSAGGSLRRIASQPVASLTRVVGIGTARATVVHAALELGRRMLSETRQEGVLIRGAPDVFALYAPRLEDLPVEEFHVAILDAQHRFQRDILVTRGLLNTSLVHPREVFREAIAERAASVILVHNHPSGDPTPSRDDRMVTDALLAASDVIGVPVHDHVVIGRGRYVSFAEQGYMLGDRRPLW